MTLGLSHLLPQEHAIQSGSDEALKVYSHTDHACEKAAAYWVLSRGKGYFHCTGLPTVTQQSLLQASLT